VKQSFHHGAPKMSVVENQAQARFVVAETRPCRKSLPQVCGAELLRLAMPAKRSAGIFSDAEMERRLRRFRRQGTPKAKKPIQGEAGRKGPRRKIVPSAAKKPRLKEREERERRGT